MAKRQIDTDFTPVSLLATPAVAKYLGATVRILDEADRLGALIGPTWTMRGDEDRGISSWQSVKSTWRDLCKDRGRPCVIGQWANKVEKDPTGKGRYGKWKDLGVFERADVTLPNITALQPISHWLFLAADVTRTQEGSGTWVARREATNRIKHLLFEKSATVSEAHFVGTEAGRLLWESFLENLRTNPIWRAALKAGPLPSPALVTSDAEAA